MLLFIRMMVDVFFPIALFADPTLVITIDDDDDDYEDKIASVIDKRFREGCIQIKWLRHFQLPRCYDLKKDENAFLNHSLVFKYKRMEWKFWWLLDIIFTRNICSDSTCFIRLSSLMKNDAPFSAFFSQLIVSHNEFQFLISTVS